MFEQATHSTKMTIKRFASEEDFRSDVRYSEEEAKRLFKALQETESEGNVLLKAGITLMLTLLIGGAGTAYNNAGAYIGVGDSDTAADDDQTGLIAETNKLWKAMEATYPQVSNQTVTFRSVFGSDDANYAWKEFTVVNASSDTGTNLNRKVSDQGTKASGQVWTVDIAITIT